MKTKFALEAVDMAEPLHTLDEVAALLHQQPSTIKAWIRDGKLQGTPIGKGWFVMDSDLQSFMERQRADAGAEIARRKAKAMRAAATREAKAADPSHTSHKAPPSSRQREPGPRPG